MCIKPKVCEGVSVILVHRFYCSIGDQELVLAMCCCDVCDGCESVTPWICPGPRLDKRKEAKLGRASS